MARERFLVNGAYVIARDGTVVAHETAGPRSTGVNLAYRPYFQQAIQGGISVYAAIGGNTHVRGLYYAAPLYDSDSPSGAIIGGASTGGTGAAVGSFSGNAGTGALIGGAVGAVGGAATAPGVLR